MVHELAFALIVQLSGPPPRVPVPVLGDKDTFVSAKSLCGLPSLACACTITLKPTPTVGLVPPLTPVMASFAGGMGGAALIVKGALLPGVSGAPLVRVAVTTMPVSAFE